MLIQLIFTLKTFLFWIAVAVVLQMIYQWFTGAFGIKTNDDEPKGAKKPEQKSEKLKIKNGISDQQLLFFKIFVMLHVGVNILRKIIDRDVKCLKTFISHLTQCHKQKNVWAQKFIDRGKKLVSAGNNISTADFDFSDLYIMIRLGEHNGIMKIDRPTDKWGKVPSSQSDIKTGDDIERLRDIRNQVAHHSTGSLSDSQFQAHFTEIKVIIIRLENYLKTDVYLNEIETIYEQELTLSFREELMSAASAIYQNMIDSGEETSEGVDTLFDTIEKHVEYKPEPRIPKLEWETPRRKENDGQKLDVERKDIEPEKINIFKEKQQLDLKAKLIDQKEQTLKTQKANWEQLKLQEKRELQIDRQKLELERKDIEREKINLLKEKQNLDLKTKMFEEVSGKHRFDQESERLRAILYESTEELLAKEKEKVRALMEELEKEKHKNGSKQRIMAKQRAFFRHLGSENRLEDHKAIVSRPMKLIVKSEKEGLSGVATGATIGAVVGGPVGAAAGALIGLFSK